MIPKNGRIKESSIEIMSKMLQTFTLSYPESNKIGPAFYVLFTSFFLNLLHIFQLQYCVHYTD